MMNTAEIEGPGNTLEKEIPRSPAQMLIAEIAVSKSKFNPIPFQLNELFL